MAPYRINKAVSSQSATFDGMSACAGSFEPTGRSGILKVTTTPKVFPDEQIVLRTRMRSSNKGKPSPFWVDQGVEGEQTDDR
jgi:hypothetical protein